MSMASRRIALTGFMGSGKTTVAAALAARLNCEMIDLDQFIELHEGRSIHSIINGDGEPRFREIESQALLEALDVEPAGVVALGGGTWTIAENRNQLKTKNCIIVWLDVPFEVCWRRIEKGNPRPLARDKAEAQKLYLNRVSDYSQASIRVVISEHQSADDVADQIIAALPKRNVE